MSFIKQKGDRASLLLMRSIGEISEVHLPIGMILSTILERSQGGRDMTEITELL
jgi:hypothetical protein